MKKTLSERKRNRVIEDRPVTAPEPAPKFTPRGASDKSRILVAVTDNRIDFKAMSPEAAKMLNELLHTPDVQAQFGIGPLSDHFDPAHCKRFYDALGRMLQTVGRFAFKWPKEALEPLLYSDQEKEELAEPTAKALDELAPRWLKENQAIATLLLVFAAITQRKLQEAALIAHVAKLRQQKTDTAEPIRVRVPVKNIVEPQNDAA